VSAPGHEAGAEPIELAGDDYEIGYQHGAACRDAIRGFLADRLAQLVEGPVEPAARARLLERAQAYGAFVGGALPHLARELEGLAAGAGISAAEATLLQYRRELAPPGAPAAAECSLVAFRGPDGEAVLAQNIDLNCAMTPLGRVIRTSPADERVPRSLVYTFAGLLGFVGINEAGVAIGINFVLAGRWELGISPYLLVRHLLRFRSAAQCLAELNRLDRSSSRCLTICDSATLAMAELTGQESRIISGDRLCHTNHYLHPDLEPRDEMNIFTRNASRRRLRILSDLVDGLGGEAAPEALFALLSDHSMYPLGLCVHAEGDPERDSTVAAVVMRPRTGELFVRRGNPCEAETRRFSLEPALARPPERSFAAAGDVAPA
jgi:hypothetical protein